MGVAVGKLVSVGVELRVPVLVLVPVSVAFDVELVVDIGLLVKLEVADSAIVSICAPAKGSHKSSMSELVVF